ncbi:MAG: MazG nucleotide pyrophosphohydrolase domain-containing protein [Patescibacteria group bacterium]|nr:MazG nucleotide pyrophosphohydrolase domain-containing protein [Patescibacteria group bacterium]
MDFQELIERARYIKGRNAEMTAAEGNTPWGAAERFQGLVGNVGDLAKLVMAKNGFRTYPDLDKKLRHELADCLWSVIILADETGVDLENAFFETMDELEARANKHRQ